MMIFLLAFIAASHSGFIWLIYRQEQQDVRSFAEEEAREHLDIVRRPTNGKPIELDEEEGSGKIFYYVFNVKGQQVSLQPAASEVEPVILDKISNWSEPAGVPKLVQFRQADGSRAVFMICSMQITDDDRYLGTVYVGKDMTNYYGILKSSLVVLIAISLLFLFIATIAGHILAGRAIIPIKRSFIRQREFVADASHELRTPLSVMLTSVDAIQSDDDNQLSEFSAQVLTDMKSEIKRMTRIVADLLTLARADAGAANLAREQFDVIDAAEHVVRPYRLLAEEKGIKLQFNGVRSLLLYADKERISQLILILIDNAIKYTPRGGNVTLEIDHRLYGSKRVAQIIVKDTGLGIPQENLELIFERFYRIDKARSREEGGTGLGLSIAKWITEAHGGVIKVSSTVGQGSSFVVLLPTENDEIAV
jgi:K+-sensing histidine kinase KdpD